MTRVFVYGTLLERDRLRATLGRVPDSRPAVLRGFRREPHPLGPWPLAAVDASSVIEGRVLEGLAAEEILTLDAYEGVGEGLYLRVATKVQVGNDRVAAWVYIKS